MTTLNTDFSVAYRNPGLFARFADALMRGIERHAQKASRRDRIEALEAKSDAELAEMGLRREDILHHVFRDLYYI